jgi:hypothetical protein
MYRVHRCPARGDRSRSRNQVLVGNRERIVAGGRKGAGRTQAEPSSHPGGSFAAQQPAGLPDSLDDAGPTHAYERNDWAPGFFWSKVPRSLIACKIVADEGVQIEDMSNRSPAHAGAA